MNWAVESGPFSPADLEVLPEVLDRRAEQLDKGTEDVGGDECEGEDDLQGEVEDGDDLHFRLLGGSTEGSLGPP